VLDLQTARGIVDTALEKAREDGLQSLAVAVLDAGGHLLAFAREDGAGIIRPDIAIGKAWGALGMGTGTRALADKSPAFLAALAAMAGGGRVVPSPGGVIVRDADGTALGAVGVSGDTGDRDEACAVAGIESVGLVADTG
jgi:uncharacterized protein GlcG (DUF336 family)